MTSKCLCFNFIWRLGSIFNIQYQHGLILILNIDYLTEGNARGLEIAFVPLVGLEVSLETEKRKENTYV